MCFLNLWNSLSRVRKGGKLKTGHSFTQSRTSLYLGGFNTTYCLFNHSAAVHRDGLPGRSAVGLGCHEYIWSQDLSLLLSGKAALVVLSKQPDVHPNRNDSSMCSGPRAIPATLLGWVAQLWVTTGTVWLDQNPLQMAALTCLYPHVASKQQERLNTTGKATFKSVFPSSLSRYLRKKVRAVKGCFRQVFFLMGRVIYSKQGTDSENQS